MRQRLIDSLCVCVCVFSERGPGRGPVQERAQGLPQQQPHLPGLGVPREGQGQLGARLPGAFTSFRIVSLVGWRCESSVENPAIGLTSARIVKHVCSLYPTALDSHIGYAFVCVLQLFRLGIEKRPWDGGAYQPYALALKERREVSTPPIAIFCSARCDCRVSHFPEYSRRSLIQADRAMFSGTHVRLVYVRMIVGIADRAVDRGVPTRPQVRPLPLPALPGVRHDAVRAGACRRGKVRTPVT